MPPLEGNPSNGLEQRQIADFSSASLSPSQERGRLIEVSTAKELISADELITIMNQDGHELTYVRQLGLGNYSSVHLISYGVNLAVCKLLGGGITSHLGTAGSRRNLETDLIALNQSLNVTPELLMVVVNQNQQLLALFASFVEGQDIRAAYTQSIHGFSKEEIRDAFYYALDEAKTGPLPLYLVDLNHNNFLVRPTREGKPEVILIDPAGIVSLDRLNRTLEQYEEAFPPSKLFDIIVNCQAQG